MQNNEHTTLSVPKGKRKENEGVPRGSRGRGDNQGNCHFHFSDCFFLIPYFAKNGFVAGLLGMQEVASPRYGL